MNRGGCEGKSGQQRAPSVATSSHLPPRVNAPPIPRLVQALRRSRRTKWGLMQTELRSLVLQHVNADFTIKYAHLATVRFHCTSAAWQRYTLRAPYGVNTKNWLRMFWLARCQLKVQQLAACDRGDQEKIDGLDSAQVLTPYTLPVSLS